MSSKSRLFLLDASSYLFRAYYAIGHLSNTKGIPTNATYGFTQMLLKLIKDQKLKKVQSQIQGDAVRISSPSRDELQGVIQLLKEQDYDVELQFGNYR